MAVLEKELIINGKAVRSPEQQVFKNMEDIAELKGIIKPEYNCSATLTSSSTSVAIASTNAPAGTTEGWLMTQDGLKFKINGGDDTNLLIEYYADLKGPQGEEGPEGPGGDPTTLIDDNSVSESKTWSSDKINDEVANAGKTYYQHNITAFVTGPLYINMTIINDSNTPLTASSILQWLKNKGFTQSDNKWYSQFLQANTSGIQSMRCRYVDDTTLGYAYLNGTSTTTPLADWTLTETVITL